MSSIIHATGHGLQAGDSFYFAAISPDDTGVDETIPYYVLASGLTANAFTFDSTPGGGGFTLAHPIIDGRILDPDSYITLDDDISSSPPNPEPPAALVAAGTQKVDASGVTQNGLVVTLTQPDDPTVRTTFVKITTVMKADGTGPDWDKASIYLSLIHI